MTGPARSLPWEPILERWAQGLQVRAIAADLEVSASNVRRIVHLSRQRGDKRAHRRRAPNGSRRT